MTEQFVEDLAQLIYDLKMVNPEAIVCVKLVASDVSVCGKMASDPRAAILGTREEEVRVRPGGALE